MKVAIFSAATTTTTATATTVATTATAVITTAIAKRIGTGLSHIDHLALVHNSC